MEKNIYHTVGTVPTFNRKIVEICKFDIPNTHINDPWHSSGTSIRATGLNANLNQKYLKRNINKFGNHLFLKYIYE